MAVAETAGSSGAGSESARDGGGSDEIWPRRAAEYTRSNADGFEFARSGDLGERS